MDTYCVTASAFVQASAEEVYALLADYREGHPSILPRPPFVFLEVDEGGFGAGTRIRYAMRVGGKTRTARADITEPVPGRVLVETDEASGIVTTFTVSPQGTGTTTEVTITTEGTARSGPLGWLERLLTVAFLRRTYRKELSLLAALAETKGRD